MLTPKKIHALLLALATMIPQGLLAQTQENHSAAAPYKAEDWQPRADSDPAHTVAAMNGPLSFLRNDWYQKGPELNQSYRPWFAPKSAVGLARTNAMGLFTRSYQANSNRVLETKNLGRFDNRNLLPFLNSSSQDSESALPAFLFMKSYSQALNQIHQLQEYLRASNGTQEPKWIEKSWGVGGEQYKILDPKIANVVLNPKNLMSDLLIGDNLKAESTTQQEKQKSTQFLNALKQVFDSHDGHASKNLSPSTLILARAEKNTAKKTELLAKIEEELTSTLSQKIATELLKPIEEENEKNNSQNPEKEQFDTAKKEHQNQQLAMCVISAYETLKKTTVTTESTTATSFLNKLHPYTNQCYDLHAPELEIDDENKKITVENLLKQHLLFYEYPLLEAKALSAQGTNPETQFSSDMIAHLFSNHFEAKPNTNQNDDEFSLDDLINDEVDEGLKKHFNPTANEFWADRRSSGQTLANQYGITVEHDRCTKPYKIQSELFKNAKDFSYTNCPAVKFDSKKFIANSTAFLNDKEAVATVFNMLTNYGLKPDGAEEFRNLLLAIEFQRRSDHAKQLNSGATTEPYKAHAIFDFEGNQDAYGLGHEVGTLICRQRPPYLATSGCDEGSPDQNFLLATSSALSIATQSLNIVETPHRKPKFYQINPNHRSEDPLRDPLLVGGTVFAIDSTRNVNSFDELQYHQMVRDSLEGMNNLMTDLVGSDSGGTGAAGRAAEYSNGLATYFSGIMVKINQAVLPKSLEARDAVAVPQRSADLYNSIDNLQRGHEFHARRLDALGIRVQHDGPYKSEVTQIDDVDEKGKPTKKRVYQSAACDKGEGTEKLASDHNHTRLTASYQHSFTCYAQSIHRSIDDSLEGQVATVKQAGKDLAWTAASIVTVPLGGALVLGAKSAIGATARAVGAGYTAYKTAGAGYRAATLGSRLGHAVKLSRIGEGVKTTGGALKGIHGAVWNGAEFTAMRSAGLMGAYAQSGKTLGLGVGIMKTFGLAGVGVQWARGKHEMTPGGGKEALLQTLVGGQDPKSLAMIAGIMIAADNLALGVKTALVSRAARKNPLLATEIQLLKNTKRSEALTGGAAEMTPVQIKRLKDMTPDDFAKQPQHVQDAFSVNTRYKELQNLLKQQPDEFAKLPQSLQNAFRVRHIDTMTTRWGNHIGADLPLTAYFQSMAYGERKKMNEPILKQIEQIDAGIKAAVAQNDKDTASKLKAQKNKAQKSLQGDLWGLDFFDVFLDVAMARAFRNARPGDFGVRAPYEFHQKNIDTFVNTAINNPKTKKVTEAPGTYIVDERTLQELKKQMVLQEGRLHQALAQASPKDLDTAPFYAPFTAAKNPDGTYTLITSEGFKGWFSYRFRDQVPTEMRNRFNQLIEKAQRSPQ